MYGISYLLSQQPVVKNFKPKSKTAILRLKKLMRKAKSIFDKKSGDELFNCFN